MSSDKNSWTVYEGDEGTVSDKMNEPDVKVGDTIHYATSNQQGAKTYEVVLKDGKKSLKLISSYEMEMDKGYMSDDSISGGKKRNKKTKSKKNRSKRTKKSKSKKNRSKRTKK